MNRAGHPGQRNRIAERETRRSRAFVAELYRQELGRHWRPRGLSKGDRLEVTRRYTRVWP
jgi:hypothetical protein